MDIYDERLIFLSMLFYLYKRKRRQRGWVRSGLRGRLSTTVFRNLFDRIQADDRKFFTYLGMTKSSFDELLNTLSGSLMRSNTLMRDSIPAKEKLVIALRYFMTGCSFFELHNTFRVGKSTACAIVKEVCEAIINNLEVDTLRQNCPQKWSNIADEYEKRTGFPHCIGAVGGKNMEIARFRNNCSCSHKNECSSMAIIAVCDANHFFTHVDARLHKKCDERGAFQKSELYEKLEDDSLDIPSKAKISNSIAEYSYVFVGSSVFPLLKNLLVPYTKPNVSDAEKIFNQRLTSTQKYIDFAFDSLANKWKILQKPLTVQLDLGKDLIKALCILHNFVRRREGITDIPLKYTMKNITDGDESLSPVDEACLTRDLFANRMRQW